MNDACTVVRSMLGTAISFGGWTVAQVSTHLSNISLIVSILAGLVTIGLGIQTFIRRRRKQ